MPAKTLDQLGYTDFLRDKTNFTCINNAKGKFKLDSVDIAGIVQVMLYGEEDGYFVERLLRLHKIYKASAWNVSFRRGYYDSVYTDTVRLTDDCNIDQAIASFMKLPTLKAKVDAILKLEYGYLLPGLEPLEWCFEKVAKDKILFGDETHYKKLEPEVVEQYKEFPFARGIVKRQGSKMFLVDGYHRLAAAEDGSKVNVIVGY